MTFIKRQIKFIIFKYIWKKKNKNNYTFPTKICDIAKVNIGYGSYGPITVSTWGSENEGLSIGKYCSIGPNVHFVLGGNHSYKKISTFPFLVKYGMEKMEAISNGPIIIGNDVWIGADVTILSGVTIGQGAVVGAGSVVTKDVLPYSVAVGNPVKVIKRRFEDDICKYLVDNLNYKVYDKQSIIEMKNLLYEDITKENYKEIVNRINDIGPGTY